MRANHEIDYKIYGEELQFVEIELDPNETADCSFMDDLY